MKIEKVFLLLKIKKINHYFAKGILSFFEINEEQDSQNFIQKEIYLKWKPFYDTLILIKINIAKK